MDRNATVFVIASIAASALLLTSGWPFAGGLAVAAAAFTLLWLVSLPLANASIVDIFWGPGFVLLGAFYLTTSPASAAPRAWLVMAFVTLWAARLALHIARRNSGAGEDFRYRAWREQAGSSFWWISLFKVFLLQAVLLWIVSSPLLLSHSAGLRASLTPWDLFGIAVFVAGFLLETVADWQLTRFKSDPTNRGKILDTGLWGRSRHPNYFGEAVLWWGLGLLAAPTGGWLALIGPIMITFLLIRISGVAMLDAALVERRPGYAEYIESTPAFIPRLSSKGRA